MFEIGREIAQWSLRQTSRLPRLKTRHNSRAAMELRHCGVPGLSLQSHVTTLPLPLASHNQLCKAWRWRYELHKI